MWQTYVDDAAPLLGGWPDRQANLSVLVENGLAGVLWDPNGLGNACGYTCAEADHLLTFLSTYGAAPLSLPQDHICNN